MLRSLLELNISTQWFSAKILVELCGKINLKFIPGILLLKINLYLIHKI